MEPDSIVAPTPPPPLGRGDWGWAGLGVLSALACYVLSFPAAAGVRDPPVFRPEWLVVGGVNLGLLLLIFWGSVRRPGGLPTRVMWGAAALLAVVDLSLPVIGYYGNYHDLPWMAAAPLWLVVVVGGWRSRQKWLAVVVVAATLAGVAGAARPPSRQPWPRAVRVGELTVSARPLKRGQRVVFYDFLLSDASGSSLAQRYDLEHAGLHGSAAWGMLPIRASHPHWWRFEDQQEATAPVSVSAHTFPPPWVRSVDLAFTVDRWPREPALAVTVPLREEGAANEARATRGGRTFTVSAAWGWSARTSPPIRCLRVRVTMVGSAKADVMNMRTRFSDQEGRPLVVRGQGGSYSWGGGGRPVREESGEIAPRPGEPLSALRVEVYDEKQMAGERLTFRFEGMPNAKEGR